MMCLQRMGIVHRDLKSANCLVDKHWTVKICDFGLSKMSLNGVVSGKSGIGTPEWTAPKLLRGKSTAATSATVFSLGVIMWEVCTMQRPWEGYKPVQVRPLAFALSPPTPCPLLFGSYPLFFCPLPPVPCPLSLLPALPAGVPLWAAWVRSERSPPLKFLLCNSGGPCGGLRESALTCP